MGSNKLLLFSHPLFIIIMYLIHGHKPMGTLALCREVVWIQHLGLHVCIQKSGTRLDLVCFSFKEVRGYLGRSQGFLRHVDVEGVAWEVMWKHNKSEFQRGLIYLLQLVFPQNNYWFAWGYWGFASLPPK